jgi:hypothetical protein
VLPAGIRSIIRQLRAELGFGRLRFGNPALRLLGQCREADVQANDRPHEIENGRDESRLGVFRGLALAARDPRFRERSPNANARPPHSKTTVDGSGTAVSCRLVANSMDPSRTSPVDGSRDGTVAPNVKVCMPEESGSSMSQSPP